MEIVSQWAPPHSPNSVFHLDLTNDLACMALDLLKELSLSWYAFSQSRFQVWLCCRRVFP